MKHYLKPEIEITEISSDDVITTSPGTETPPYDENDGNWNMGTSMDMSMNMNP